MTTFISRLKQVKRELLAARDIASAYQQEHLQNQHVVRVGIKSVQFNDSDDMAELCISHNATVFCNRTDAAKAARTIKDKDGKHASVQSLLLAIHQDIQGINDQIASLKLSLKELP